MADKYYTLVTEYGLRELMKAVQRETKVNITEFAVGDGGGAKCTPRMTAEALENEVWRGAVSACYISKESENTLIVESMVPYDAGGFTVREMGVFDNKGGMIAVCNTPDTQKANFSDGILHELSLSMELDLVNAYCINLDVDPNVVSATKKDIKMIHSEMAQHIRDAAAAQQAALDALYAQLAAYTLQKIADLVNGAPSTMDTLGEIAKAMQDNADVVAALDAAIGRKASAAEFDSHAKDSTAHITAAERNSWNRKADLGLLAGYLPLDGGTMRGNIVTTRLEPAANRRYTIGAYSKMYSDIWAVSVNTENVLSPQGSDFLNLGSNNGPVYISPDAGDYVNIIVENIDDGDGNINGALYAGGKNNTEHKENWLGTPDCPWDNVFTSKINSKTVPSCSMSGTTLYINF